MKKSICFTTIKLYNFIHLFPTYELDETFQQKWIFKGAHRIKTFLGSTGQYLNRLPDVATLATVSLSGALWEGCPISYPLNCNCRR